MSRNRKELDKESMFKKIMPSAGEPVVAQAAAASFLHPTSAPAAPLAAADAESTALGQPLPSADAQHSEPPLAQAALAAEPAAPQAAQTAPAQDTTADAAPAPSDTLPAPEKAAQADSDYTLVNLSRIVMEEKLNAALDKFNCCKCEKCSMDVLAIALNKIKPQYVMVKNGDSPLSYVSPEISREIVTALVQSILVVKSHPRH